MSNSCYHYTNLESLMHIINNESLHFGCLGMMNDSQEMILEDDVLNRVTSFLEHHNYKDDFLKESQFKSFSFSASKKRDDLSQWRSYTNLGTGVSLEINRKSLELDVFEEFGRLSKYEKHSFECIYNIDKKMTELDGIFDFFNTLERKKPLSSFSSVDLLSVSRVVDLQYFFYEFLSKSKNASFYSEEEVRFFIDPIRINNKLHKVRYKPCMKGLTSYVEVGISELTIKSIMLGPCVDKRNVDIIKSMLKHDIPIYYSESSLV